MKIKVYFAALFLCNLALITHDAPLSLNWSILKAFEKYVLIKKKRAKERVYVIRIVRLRFKKI